MDSEIDHNPDDAYAEDDLPDLVLDTRKDSSSSLEGQEDSNSSSVIDLLFNLSRERRSVSSSDVANWIDAGNDEIDNFDTEQVHAERTLNDDFKVTYTNHGKAYVPKISDKYRSYLSLMPDEEEGEVQDEATKAKIHEERQKILAHFQALTGQQQEEQREIWTEELSILEEEIAQLKIKLGAKLNRRNHLRLLLGFDMIKKVAKKSVDHLAKEFKDLLQNAKTSNEPLQQQPSSSSQENNNSKIEINQ